MKNNLNYLLVITKVNYLLLLYQHIYYIHILGFPMLFHLYIILLDYLHVNYIIKIINIFIHIMIKKNEKYKS
jgi:hypothetical protein